MALPFFYVANIKPGDANISLEEDTSKHITQVLRMEPGEKLQLTDGRGNLFTAEISQAHKKATGVKILSATSVNAPSKRVAIAISLLKNASRFEWFLEKVAELGVTEIIPLICERTEKHHFRFDRMQSIVVSAMLQSQQSWLATLHEPAQLLSSISGFNHAQKLIAHCEQTEKRALNDQEKGNDALILIGPEGDFSRKEIDLALENNFKPVSLGNTRLRTETAGIVAATLLVNL